MKVCNDMPNTSGAFFDRRFISSNWSISMSAYCSAVWRRPTIAGWSFSSIG
jgi:hypothetical protein